MCKNSSKILPSHHWVKGIDRSFFLGYIPGHSS